MASLYITIVTQNERTNRLMALITRTLQVSQDWTQTKNELDAILGNPVVYTNLIGKCGVSTEQEAINLYNMIVAAKTAMDATGITQVTKNIGL